MSLSSISYLWREPRAAQGFSTGVSLHSHTNRSRETLDFIAELSRDWEFVQPLMRWAENRSSSHSGIRPDYSRAFWTPPLPPAAAFQLESKQIADHLQLPSLVSISDHDTIEANELLHSIHAASDIPVSVEWTVPYNRLQAPAGSQASSRPDRQTCFHLGIHNMPPAAAAEWMSRLAAYTNTVADSPEARSRRDSLLGELLAALHELPDVLIVFNHPLWDLYRIGQAEHDALVNDFLARHGQFLHALELNGLRNWRENRSVADLALRWNMLPISGGDRHGIEPNANVNLSRSTSFAGFVHEVRRERQSHVVFMPQYAEPWKHRILQSTLDAIRNHPHLPEGCQRWDERVFHPDTEGNIRPLSTLWTAGRPTHWVTAVLVTVRALGSRPVAGPLRYAWSRNRVEAESRRVALASTSPA